MASALYKSDTGLGFGLDDHEANRRRLYKLMAYGPCLLHQTTSYRLYQCPRGSSACFFQVESARSVITHYVEYKPIELPFGGKTVVASSWANVADAVETVFTELIFLDTLPRLADTIVSDLKLPREGLRFWVDLQARAIRRGFETGVVADTGKLVPHTPNTILGEDWVDDFDLIQESETVGEMRLYYQP